MRPNKIDGKSWLHFVSRGYGNKVESKEDGRRLDEFGSELPKAVTGTRQVMLKICWASEPGRATLQLAGRLGGEWVSELERAYGMACSQDRHVILDFADVVFVDRTGTELIRGLLDKGVSLINCSPFIAEQLKQS